MIEKIVKDYLDDHLDINVYLEVPKNGDTFIVLEKTGSREDEHIYNSTIAVQSYAKSLYEAAQLNEQIKVIMKNIRDLDQISQCKLNSDYNFTDVETKRYRYQAVFNLIHY